MRLGPFINANIEPILMEWERFARSIWPKGRVADPQELRDSAEEILRAIVADMDTAQNHHFQNEKSQGRGAGGMESDRLDFASQVHGAGRVGSGLGMAALLAEYRALRASVLRLWKQSNPNPDPRDLDDLTRFNEAIDQSITLAVTSFAQRVDSARQMFLAILGHDLRNPLSAITLTAKVVQSGACDASEVPEHLAQIVGSAHAISDLVTDLIDFASTSLGEQMPLKPVRADLHALADEVAREVRAAHPGREIRSTFSGNLAGTWDPHRLRQAIANLLINALQHGAQDNPVTLSIDGDDDQTVVVRVHNMGTPIPSEALPTLFDPLVRGPMSVQERSTPGSIGLGLYIVREIVTSHGGTVEMTSSAADGTTATLRLPRQ